MKARFWYSERQKNVYSIDPKLNPDPQARLCAAMLQALRLCMPEERETKAFVTLPVNGEMVELEYTEMSHDANYWPSWDDAILLGEAEDAKIRVEEVSA